MTCFDIGEGFDWGSAGFPLGAQDIRYRVIRATAAGECYIDEWYGGEPDGYVCKPNNFWTVDGPIYDNNNIRVHFPQIPTPGLHTYGSVTANVPDILDGVTSVTANPQLQWTVSITYMNTEQYGGYNGPFDFNNYDTEDSMVKIKINAQEEGLLYWQ